MNSPLFESANEKLARMDAPLADRMRPRKLGDYLGQDEVAGPESALRRAIERDELGSLILFGPPGSGKTTLGRIVAEHTQARFVAFSAVTGGIKDAREIIQRARDRLLGSGQRTILFVDEIHRFNKAQQDAFLPHVENGTIQLIGATTENPSFEINAALLSRCKVIPLKPLGKEALGQILTRALFDRERGLGAEDLQIEDEALELLVQSGQGDARAALSNLEWVVACLPETEDPQSWLTAAHVRSALPHKALRYDKSGDEHFQQVSALQKSIRGSDPHAALYWLARMLAAGEDPMFLARRLVRIASEDVGLADPAALPQALAAQQAWHFLGSPEGELALAQAALYLATAPKSNSVGASFGVAREAAKAHGPLPVPMALRNAPTRLMKNLGYGKGYKYDHDADDAYEPQEYLPDELRGEEFYAPGRFGFEREIRKRLEWWAGLRRRKHDGNPSESSGSEPESERNPRD